ncbi:ribosome small subunit-dependent GTPase A [Photobacterium galatheae]|uniref:Small ribosomal subunit biogenesis GTPase RsgA n=1 Tax=Photobacterium galatheae TaxID=1654360 RepID=A0A066RVQ2_9GAMM|nr:ribosome small subunit-dependent GTPase A [Photobacterium galatheae]KDM91468.1 GTPase RsgA [Photobacterium galatheae]MCM0149540.1 ribosome small subunit-dependent GTPase A [Photobacterium galatheae]
MTKIISQPTYALQELGWKPFFQQQLSLQEWEVNQPARVSAVHKSRIEVLTEHGQLSIATLPAMPTLAVGDWILVSENNHFTRLLERFSNFQRKAAGSKVAEQLIASNIDTVFIVCSLNQDFNLSRIERYLALANQSGVEPVIVLSKADCIDDPLPFIEQVRQIDNMLMVEAVNGLDPNSVGTLSAWCGKGKTVAFLGSSGAGKSTLVNTLLSANAQLTGGIREDDSKGRHTTTSRSMHLMPEGALLLDTPGMRELQLADCSEGLAVTFADIETLADQCRFGDCSHQQEPGCAVLEAIESGELDERRLRNYHKLNREIAFNTATIAEKRAQSKQLGRYYHAIQKSNRKHKNRE